MRTFAGIEEQYADFENARVLLQPITYDGTSTWGKGADEGPEAFLEAAENMELYDIETGTEVYRQGIHLLDTITEDSSPEKVFETVYGRTKELLDTGKFLTFFGGEHSVSIGILKAFYEKYPGITILQLDAHTDLRPEYMGTPYNHACAVFDASRNANLVQVGIRSMDVGELEYLDRSKCFFMHEIADNEQWMDKSLALVSDTVYITLDLDVFDPAIVPGTGTPEPGGMQWYPMMKYLRKVFETKNVVGFDIVELAPIEGNRVSEFLAAKLYYKMLSYQFMRYEQ